MKDDRKTKIIGAVLLLTGIVFLIEGYAVTYIIGIVPPFAAQASQEVSQFLALALWYGILKLAAGAISAAAGIALLAQKQ